MVEFFLRNFGLEMILNFSLCLLVFRCCLMCVCRWLLVFIGMVDFFIMMMGLW